ncbi:OmpA family protein [bacterium]|nr:OmpA family protein [bacterium]
MRILLINLILVISAQALACSKHSSLKPKSTWQNVTNTNTTKILSREGMPLQARFAGTESTTPVAVSAKPAIAAPVATAAPVAESFDSTYKFTFDSNAKNPKAQETAILKSLQAALKSGDFKEVKIIGFADQTGNATYNKSLSLQRAQNIQKMIKSQKVAKNLKMSTIGGGVKTDENLQDARIVEVQLVK